jgi:hypothetical protein
MEFIKQNGLSEELQELIRISGAIGKSRITIEDFYRLYDANKNNRQRSSFWYIDDYKDAADTYYKRRAYEVTSELKKQANSDYRRKKISKENYKELKQQLDASELMFLRL